MKQYKLKRDLPTFNEGDEFCLNNNNDLYLKDSNIMAYNHITLEKFPNILTDWFEEIPEESNRWRAEYGEKYWCIGGNGHIYSSTEDEHSTDSYRFNTGNYFKTEEEAEAYKEYLLAKQKLMNGIGQLLSVESGWDIQGVEQPTDYVLEQYTGLHDKNGKEIYEGDVVEYVFNVREAEVSAIGEVCFFEGQGAYGIKNVKYNNQELRRLCDIENERAGEVFCSAGYDNTEEDQTLIFTDYYFVEDDMEIIGNIHENPELLEGEKR